MTPEARFGQVAIVVPVKCLYQAKTRTALPPQDRAALALQLMEHSVSAALACPPVTHVLVVTADPLVAAQAHGLGAIAIKERASVGLNAAARLGLGHARQLLPVDHLGVMVSDLPELSPDDLAEAVHEYQALNRPMLVADHHGTGTTLLLHSTEERPDIRFGPDSAKRHITAGYQPARGALHSLRRDLDTRHDLRIQTFL